MIQNIPSDVEISENKELGNYGDVEEVKQEVESEGMNIDDLSDLKKTKYEAQPQSRENDSDSETYSEGPKKNVMAPEVGEV